MRINKFLSEAGVCSRREGDRMIAAGRVMINGLPASAGDQVKEGDTVLVDNKPVAKQEKMIVLLLNKPRGIVCSTVSTHGEQNIVDYVNYPTRVFPVGRLDKASEGAILLTNRGDWVNDVLRGRYEHEKEYHVTIDRPYDQHFLEQMSAGVEILDQVTKPCQVYPISADQFGIILTQGINRQIRRMCEALGYEVTKLERIRFMNITLGDLPRGQYRELTLEERRDLMAACNKTEDGNDI